MNVSISYAEIDRYVCSRCKSRLADGSAMDWGMWCSKCAAQAKVTLKASVVPLLIKLAWNAALKAGIEPTPKGDHGDSESNQGT